MVLSCTVRPLVTCLLAGIVFAGVAGTASAAGAPTIEERLAGASPERGRELFRVCRACHSAAAGAAHALGPNLWGVIGRPVASAGGFEAYTPAIIAFGGIWSAERLDRYLHRPAAEVEGTSMVFPGIADAGERADLIAWLDLLSDSPSASERRRSGGVPEAAASPESTSPEVGILVIAEGAQATHAYCTVCHSERIVAQQGLSREDWEEVLEYMVDEHGMTPIEAPDFDLVIEYLSTHYGPERPNFPQQ